jgi:hypothetical protein
MRFTLLQLLFLVTAVCLVCGLAAYVPPPVAWALAVMAMMAGFLGAVLTGGSRSRRWWRATLTAWLGLLLVAGVLFPHVVSIYVVEALWLTGLPALAIGTSLVLMRGQPGTADLLAQTTPAGGRSCGRERGPRGPAACGRSG